MLFEYPLYTGILAGIFLPEEPLRARLVLGVVIAIGGLALSFAESLNLGDEDLALAGAAALALAPLGASIGNVAQKLRARNLDAVTLNGWAMLAGGGLLLAVSAIGEDWGEFRLAPRSVGSIVYLALIGSAVAFVGLTVLLRHLTAQAMSFLAMLLPFGALLFGAVLYDEALTWRALAGALLVRFGTPVMGLHVRVSSEIPMAAGLGSSAAAAIAGFRLYEAGRAVPLDTDAMLAMATELEGHPDNAAAALLGGITVGCQTDDGRVVARAWKWPDAIRFVVATPDSVLETKQARAALPASIPLADAISDLRRALLFLRASRPATTTTSVRP